MRHSYAQRYIVRKLPGIGGLSARWAIDDVEPFTTFESIAAAAWYLRRATVRLILRRPFRLDLTDPDWSIDAQTPLPVRSTVARIHRAGGHYAVTIHP